MSFKVMIEEKVSQAFTVEAENPEQARDIANAEYRRGNFVLEPGDLIETRMAVQDDEGNELLPYAQCRP